MAAVTRTSRWLGVRRGRGEVGEGAREEGGGGEEGVRGGVDGSGT